MTREEPVRTERDVRREAEAAVIRGRVRPAVRKMEAVARVP